MSTESVSYVLWCFWLYHYTTIKFIMTKRTSNNLYLKFLATPPTILYLITSVLLLSICGLYKLFVYACLKMWYGKKFIKFVPGCGVATSFETRDFGHINVMGRITTHLSGNELFDQINDQIFEKFFITDIRNQLLCCISRAMGYSFVVNVRDLEIEEVFREIKTDKIELTNDELQNYMDKYFGSGMPRNGELAWDMALCTTPVEDPEAPVGTYTYVLLIRVAHALGDGLVFHNLLSNAFTKPSELFANYIEKLTQTNEKITKLKKCPSHVVNMLEAPFNKRELIWTGNTLTCGHFAAKQRDCLWKIKEIRNCIPGLTFLTVIISAYTASLGDYFLKYHCDDVPETINIACPLQVDVNRIKRMLIEGGENDFNNDFSAFQLVCPILINGKTKGTIIQRLHTIQEEFDRVFNSFDIQSLYINFKVFFYVFPLPLVRLFFLRLFYGTMLSCIPGGPKTQFFNGAEVKFPAFFLPMQHAFGMAIGVLTYGNQLQVGFTLDNNKFDSKEKVDLLINGFFDYIDIIHSESIKHLSNNSVSRL